MVKTEKEYIKEYGNIPSDYEGRLNYLLDSINYKKNKESVYDIIEELQNIKWNKTTFTIYLLPKATPRPRAGKYGVFYVKGAKDNKKIFEKYMIDIDFDLITTPAKFKCRCYFPIPKSMNKKEKILAELGYIRPTSKPDWDNVAKAYCDMIQGFLIYDDSLIVEGSSEKFYSIKPRIEIELSWMDDYDSKFNKNKMKKMQR